MVQDDNDAIAAVAGVNLEGLGIPFLPPSTASLFPVRLPLSPLTGLSWPPGLLTPRSLTHGAPWPHSIGIAPKAILATLSDWKPWTESASQTSCVPSSEVSERLRPEGFISPLQDYDKEDVVLEAIKRDFTAFAFASERLQDSTDFVLEAIECDFAAFAFASERLQGSTDFVLEAIERDFRAFAFASERLRDSTDFVLKAVGVDDRAFSEATERVRKDKRFLQGVLELPAIKGNLDTGVNSKTFLRHDPNYALASLVLGIKGGGRVGNKEYSVKNCYEAALRHDPKDAVAWTDLGIKGGGRVGNKEYSEKDCYEAALRNDPKDAMAWTNLGTEGGGRVGDKEYSEKDCYEAALRHDPNCAVAWYNLGVAGGGRVGQQEYSEKDCYEAAWEIDANMVGAAGSAQEANTGSIQTQERRQKRLVSKEVAASVLCAAPNLLESEVLRYIRGLPMPLEKKPDLFVLRHYVAERVPWPAHDCCGASYNEAMLRARNVGEEDVEWLQSVTAKIRAKLRDSTELIKEGFLDTCDAKDGIIKKGRRKGDALTDGVLSFFHARLAMHCIEAMEQPELKDEEKAALVETAAKALKRSRKIQLDWLQEVVGEGHRTPEDLRKQEQVLQRTKLVLALSAEAFHLARFQMTSFLLSSSLEETRFLSWLEIRKGKKRDLQAVALLEKWWEDREELGDAFEQQAQEWNSAFKKIAASWRSAKL